MSPPPKKKKKLPETEVSFFKFLSIFFQISLKQGKNQTNKMEENENNNFLAFFS